MAVFYFGFSVAASRQCLTCIGQSVKMKTMGSCHNHCGGMDKKAKPENCCCKNACQEIKAYKGISETHFHDLLSSPVMVELGFMLMQTSFPIEKKKETGQPPPLRHSEPAFILFRNLRI
jgi:hypothetical protein